MSGRCKWFVVEVAADEDGVRGTVTVEECIGFSDFFIGMDDFAGNRPGAGEN